MRRLIVTADDFGAAVEINEAVEAAHRGGVLTAASLMVTGPAAADAVARACRMPSLRVGLHLVLVEGRPVLPASALSELVDDRGLFRSDMAAVGMRLACSRQARRQLANEITAQFETFRSTGLALDHCNAHKHFHLHPVIGSLLVSIGARFGLRAARVPVEPARVLRKVEAETAWTSNVLMEPWARLLRRRVRAAGLLAPDHVLGLRWSGEMTAGRLAGLIRNLPHGLTEIYLHPATGPYEGSAPGYRYAQEFSALMSAEVRTACRDTSVQVGGFRDFLSPEPAVHAAT